MCNNIKPVQFIGADAEFWFWLVEEEFKLHDERTPDFELRAVIHALPERIILHGGVKEALQSEPLEQRYEKLKKAVIEVSKEVESARVVELLSGEKKGHRSYIEFLKHLRSLKVDGVKLSDVVLKTKLVNEMPERTQKIVAAPGSDSTTLDEMASCADAVQEHFPEFDSPATGGRNYISGQSVAELSSCCKQAHEETSELRKKIGQFSLKFKEQSRENEKITQTIEMLKKTILANQEEYRSKLKDSEDNIKELKEKLKEKSGKSKTEANKESDEEEDDGSHSSCSGPCSSVGKCCKVALTVQAAMLSAVIGQQIERNYCYYHTRFGNQAYKCQLPCDWDEDDRRSIYSTRS